MSKFGELLRQERKERGYTLGDLAKKLGISVPYLSQIETGSKPLQDGFVDKVIRELGLIGDDVNQFRRAAATAMSEFAIRLESSASGEDRFLASVLATGFARLSADKKDQIRKIMQEDRRG